jgi:hypothetical protein
MVVNFRGLANVIRRGALAFTAVWARLALAALGLAVTAVFCTANLRLPGIVINFESSNVICQL